MQYLVQGLKVKSYNSRENSAFEFRSVDVRGNYELTPQGLLYQVKTSQRTLVVPVCCRQHVLRSCRDDLMGVLRFYNHW